MSLPMPPASLEARLWWLGPPWSIEANFVAFGIALIGMLCALIAMLCGYPVRQAPLVIVGITVGLAAIWYAFSMQMGFRRVVRHARSEALALTPHRARRLYVAQAWLLLPGIGLGIAIGFLTHAPRLFCAFLIFTTTLAIAAWASAQVRSNATSAAAGLAMLPAFFPFLMPYLEEGPDTGLWLTGVISAVLLSGSCWWTVWLRPGSRTLSERFALFRNQQHSIFWRLFYPLLFLSITLGRRPNLLPLLLLGAVSLPAICTLPWLSQLRSEMRLRWLGGQSRQDLLSFVLRRLVRRLQLSCVAMSAILLGLRALDYLPADLVWSLMGVMPCAFLAMCSGMLAELSFRPIEDKHKLGRLVAWLYLIPGVLIGTLQIVALRNEFVTVITTLAGYSLVMGIIFASYVRRCWPRIEL